MIRNWPALFCHRCRNNRMRHLVTKAKFQHMWIPSKSSTHQKCLSLQIWCILLKKAISAQVFGTLPGCRLISFKEIWMIPIEATYRKSLDHCKWTLLFKMILRSSWLFQLLQLLILPPFYQTQLQEEDPLWTAHYFEMSSLSMGKKAVLFLELTVL